MEKADKSPGTVREELLEKMNEIGDVTFLVGSDEEEVKAFVFLLRSLSPVFETMFDEKWKSPHVKVPDVEPKIFRQFLKLLLTDSSKMEDLIVMELDLESGSELSVVETVNLLYVANKYMVKKIQEACTRTIRKNIKVSNVVLTYEALKSIRESELEAVALKFIIKNINDQLEDPSFSKLSAKSLTLILSDDELCVDELALFNGVYSDKDAPIFSMPFDTRARQDLLVNLFSYTPSNRIEICGFLILGPDELFPHETDAVLDLYATTKDGEELVFNLSTKTDTEKRTETQQRTGFMWNPVVVLLPNNTYHFRARSRGFKALEHVSRLISFVSDGDRLKRIRIDMLCKTNDGKFLITEEELKIGGNADFHMLVDHMYCPSEEVSIRCVKFPIVSSARRRVKLRISEVETGLDVDLSKFFRMNFDLLLDPPLSMKPQHTYHFVYELYDEGDYALAGFTIENGTAIIPLRRLPC